MSTHNSLAVIGAGGHAKVVIDVLRAQGQQVEACLVTGPKATAPETCNGVPVRHVGAMADALTVLAALGLERAFVAVGDNAIRQSLSLELAAAGVVLPNAIDPRAIIAPSVRLGQGVLVMPGAIINADTDIADGVIINTGACIDHDCQIGAFAHIAPACALAGGVRVGALGFCGIGARVIPGIMLGARVLVGAGAVVTCDLHDGVRAVGVPARRL